MEVIGPVTVKLPDIVALPVYGNAAPPPPFIAYDAVSAYDAYDAVPVNNPLNEPVKLPVEYEPVKLLKELVVTNDAVLIVVPPAFKAYDAVKE